MVNLVTGGPAIPQPPTRSAPVLFAVPTGSDALGRQEHPDHGVERVQVLAPAKLNLALSVGGPQPPRNCHPICSWFVPVDLCDRVTIERAREGEPAEHSIRWHDQAPVPSPIDWPIEKDLTVRALQALRALTGHPLPCRIIVEKRIPVGGGLGGGSSDCAAALRGLDALFGLRVSPSDLRAVAASLGSDVPFFIDGGEALGAPPGAALVSGYGERIERLPHVPGWAVLVLPPAACPTGPVYAAFDRQVAGHDQVVNEARVRAAISQSVIAGAPREDLLFNDLAEAATVVAPLLRRVMAVLRSATGRVPMVTGSGSTVFMTVAGPDQAGTLRTQAAEALSQAGLGCGVLAARLLG
jgi:4-diphosphocytidyl-2-C-methyl-D-erythritol kinase